MSIGKKLYIGFSSIIVLMIISAVISYNEMSTIDEDYSFLLADRVEKVLIVNEIDKASRMQGLHLRSYYIEPKQATLENLQAQSEIIQESIDELRSMIVLKDMIEQLDIIEASQADFQVAANNIITNIDESRLTEAADSIANEARPANEAMSAAIATIVERQQQLLLETQQETQTGAKNAKTLLITVTILAVIVGAGLAIIITNKIRNPIVRLKEAAAIIAQGDLSQPDVKASTKDEVNALTNSFNEMKANLRQLIKSVSVNVEQTSAATEELAASTEQVAQTADVLSNQVETVARGGQQSAQIGLEGSIAVEQTANSIHTIAQNTQQLQTTAQQTQLIATSGDQTLKHAEQQMEMIQQSSNETNSRIQQLAVQSAQIENISQTITAIAAQTNLLALNASIEAARAGEAGKGFAVVADEVRKLAEESKDSAEQIGQLTSAIHHGTKSVEEAIGSTVNNVAGGVASIQDAQQSFTQILGAIEGMTNQIIDVSATTEQVSAATQQVAATVNEMAQTAKVTAEQSEEMAAATEEQTATLQEISGVARTLTEDAQRLQEEINQFKY